MNKEQFLEELAGLLSDISPAEREEALAYYRQYFEDANLSEEEVSDQLGSAKSVADSIRTELADKELVVYGADSGQTKKERQTRKTGDTPQGTDDEGHLPYDRDTRWRDDWSGDWKDDRDTDWNGAGNDTKGGYSALKITLLVILGICASPVLLAVAGGLIGLLVGAVAVLFGLFIAAAACALAFGVAAVF